MDNITHKIRFGAHPTDRLTMYSVLFFQTHDLFTYLATCRCSETTIVSEGVNFHPLHAFAEELDVVIAVL
jgi:hypothetical protein